MYDLPPHASEDDQALLHNIVAALQATSRCTAYRVSENRERTCYFVRGTLGEDTFEVDADDLFTLHSASILRVERVAVARVAGRNELVVKVLNCKQRVAAEAAPVFVPVKRRRLLASADG